MANSQTWLLLLLVLAMNAAALRTKLDDVDSPMTKSKKEETSKHPMQILLPKLLPNVRDRIPLYKVPQSFHPPFPLMIMPMTRIPIATYYRDPNIRLIKEDLLGHPLHEKLLLPQYTSTKQIVPYTTLLYRNINFPYYFQHTFSQGMARTFDKHPQLVEQTEFPSHGVSPYHHRIPIASLNMQNTSDNNQAANTTNKLQMVTTFPKQGIENKKENSFASEVTAQLDALSSDVKLLNNLTIILPVFSTNESDFQEEEKELQIWQRSRLPSSAIEILSDDEENLNLKSTSDKNSMTGNKSSNFEGRTPNFNNSSNHQTSSLLRGEPIEQLNSPKACCWRIKVAFTNGHSDTPVYKLHRYIYGYYEMEPGLVNGRNHYTSVHGDGLFALAFCGDSWWIQLNENRGECKGWAHSGWTIDQCVHDIEYTWRYYLPPVDTFIEAKKGLSIWCKS